MKNIFISILVIFILLYCQLCYSFQDDNSTDSLLVRAKRKFQEKERQYFKKRGISNKLNSLITRFKRSKLIKRRDAAAAAPQGAAAQQGSFKKTQPMYVIKDGDVVPLNNIDVPDMAGKGPFTEGSVPPSGSKKLSNEFTVLPLVVPINSLTSDYESLNSDDKIINKIMKDVDVLVKSKKGKNVIVEGAQCNVNGTWISETGGLQMKIRLDNGTGLYNRVELQKIVAPNNNGFLCDGDWEISANTPFPHSSMVILIGLRKEGKKIATFIGECRICGGSEYISGQWLIGRSSLDCKDQKASHTSYSDLLRRENINKIQKCHLQDFQKTSTTCPH